MMVMMAMVWKKVGIRVMATPAQCIYTVFAEE